MPKELIHGLIYDTEESELLLEKNIKDFYGIAGETVKMSVNHRLYKTRNGRWFFVRKWNRGPIGQFFVDLISHKDPPPTFEAVTKQEVQEWCFKNKIDPAIVGLPYPEKA